MKRETGNTDLSAVHRKVYRLLGLAEKAGRVKSGTFLTEEAVRTGKARLVLLAEDAERNSRKTVTDKCSTYHVTVCEYGTKEELGAAMGKGLRSCAAITDAGFAEAMQKLLGLQEKEMREGWRE